MSSPLILRPYQVETADKCVAYLRAPIEDHGLAIVPTGGGKSLLLADIVSKLDGEAIIFQPSREILEQNLAKFESYGYSPAVWSASMGRKELGAITLATIGSVVKRAELFSHFRYMIVDEAHGLNSKAEGSMFMKFIAGLDRPRLLGLSATPYRLSVDGYGGAQLKFLTRTRPRVFSTVIHVVQTGDLMRDGYLCPLVYKEVSTGIREDRLRLNSTGADYTDESVREHFKELNFSDQIVRCVNRLEEYGRGQSIIFTRFVEEAEYVASRIPDCAVVSAQTPKDVRAAILNDFKNGAIRHIANCAVLVLGFDFPALSNVVFARPTRSLTLWYQAVGRVLRPHPSKTDAWVIDLVGCTKKFGKVEEMRVIDGGNGKWHVESNGRHLTNTYFEQQKPKWHPNGRDQRPGDRNA